MKKIAIIGTDWNSSAERKASNGYGGVTYYRLIKPLLNLKGYDVTYHGADLLQMAEKKSPVDFWSDFVKQYDLFIIKHIDNAEAASNLLFFAQRHDKKVILDMDDNLLEIKPDQPAYETYKQGSEKRAVVLAFISMVDAIFVSTQPLADYYDDYIQKVFNKKTPIFVLPNYNDISDWDFKPSEKYSDRTVIGWMGSTTHLADLKIVLHTIQRLMKEYPNLYFELIGGLTHEQAPEFFASFDEELLDRVYCGSGTVNWEGYPEHLSKEKWDIGIAPLTQDEFNRGKSHIKWMEYAMYKIPCVASRVYPYHEKILGQDTITDGETGLLCDKKEWYKKLKKLIDNKELREKIGNNAYEYIKNNLQYKDHLYLWEDAVSKFV